MANEITKVTDQNGVDHPFKDAVAQVGVIANTKLIKDTVGWSGKNKLSVPNSISGQNGITAIVKEDKSIVFNGTATADCSFALNSELDNYLDNGKEYILSGCTTGSNSTYYLQYLEWGGSASVVCTTQEVKFTKGTGGTMRMCRFFVKNGTTLSNVTIKPMIRDADILDSTYEPYFGSTAFPRSEQAVLGAKNVIKNNLVSSTTANVEVVVNSDKSVSMSNTANDNVWLLLYRGLNYLPKGHWHLSGCPNNGGAEKYFLCFIVRNADNTANDAIYYDYGDGVDFDITDANINRNINIYIYVKNGQATNFIYYPMISLDGGTYVAPTMTNEELTERANVDYSTNEQNTGLKWIDGKPLYQKTIDCGSLPNNTAKDVAHGISNIKKLVKISGAAYVSSGTVIGIPLPNASTASATVEIKFVGENINIKTMQDMSGFNASYITIQYTKTTD